MCKQCPTGNKGQHSFAYYCPISECMLQKDKVYIYFYLKNTGKQCSTTPSTKPFLSSEWVSSAKLLSASSWSCFKSDSNFGRHRQRSSSTLLNFCILFWQPSLQRKHFCTGKLMEIIWLSFQHLYYYRRVLLFKTQPECCEIIRMKWLFECDVTRQVCKVLLCCQW